VSGKIIDVTKNLLFQKAIEIQGRQAIREGITDPKNVAVDKSLFPARGPAWHKRDRQAGKRPRGVDTQVAWGYSEYHGWVCLVPSVVERDGRRVRGLTHPGSPG
jgi:hypothetical protein